MREAKVSDESSSRLKQPPARRQVAIAHADMFNDVEFTLLARDCWTTHWSTGDLRAWSQWSRAGQSHGNRTACIPVKFPQEKARSRRRHRRKPKKKPGNSKSLCTHEGAKLGEASEKVRPCTTAAEEDIVNSSILGNTKSCIGRGTMVKSKTVPILLHVAKDESQVRTGESRIWAGLVSNIQRIDGLRRSGMRSELVQTMMIRGLNRWIQLVHSLGELRTWEHGLTTWMNCSLKHRQRSVFPSSGATKSFSQFLETAREKGARVAHRWTTPNRHCNASRGLPQQHHTALEHAGTHGEMRRQVEQGHGGT